MATKAPELDPRVYDAEDDISAQAAAARKEMEGAGIPVQEIMVSKIAELRASGLAEAIQGGKRAFVSGTVKTFRQLVQGGKPTTVYQGTEMPFLGGQAPAGVETRRLGDIFARFTGGILVVDPATEEGAIITAWCEAHPEVCRDATDPQTDVWVALKESQQNTSLKEPSLAPDMDIDKVMAGDYSGFGNTGSVGARARQILAAGQ